jgi:hypothetical protein
MSTFMKRSVKGLIPTSIVAVVLLASWLAPARMSNYNLASVCSYGYLGAPTVTGINPTSGVLAGGASVVITGCGFTGTTSVHFGATSASFTFNSDSQVTATSPAHAGGLVDVTVTTAAGTSAIVAADQFTYSTACVTANIVPDKLSPQVVGTLVTFTASSTNCPSPQYKVWVQDPNGNWTLGRDYGSATIPWNTAGLAIGLYHIDVWARNTGSAAAYEAVQVIGYVLETAPPGCASVNLFSDQSGNPQSGTLVVWSAFANGCSNPEFKFFLQKAGGGWTMVRDWDGSTWTWDSAGAVGTYNVDVWARQIGSGATYEAVVVVSITVNPAVACTIGTLNPDKATPQQQGTVITFTDTVFSCQQPEFKWYFQSPGGTWTLAQDWMVSTPSNNQQSFVWSTAGAATGTWHVDVWAREHGSTATYETLQNIPYVISAAVACATAALVPDKATPQQSGTIVTFTASSTGCSQPSYKFYVQSTTGVWTLARDWGGSNLLSWNTAGLPAGTYHIVVWARQNGSSASYEAVGNTPYVLTAAVACTTPNVVPDKASPQARGTTVTFTATSAACSQPTYFFYVQLPNGTWTTGQGWDGNVFVWNTTTGMAAGTYHIDVWIRQNGSTASYEVLMNIAYTLT